MLRFIGALFLTTETEYEFYFEYNSGMRMYWGNVQVYSDWTNTDTLSSSTVTKEFTYETFIIEIKH